MTDRHAVITNSDPSDDTVRIPYSKYKLLTLSAICFLMSIAAFSKLLDEGVADGDPVSDYGLIVIGIAIGGWMLHWAFEKRPALVIDADGISAIRPDTGLIPWRCVSALGMTKLAIIRAAVMVGIDEDQATGEEKERWKRRYASKFMNPSLSRFQTQTGVPQTIQISISFMAIGRKGLQQILEDKVHRDEPQ